MNELDQIRNNLLQASASLDAIGRNAPPKLRQQINDAWQRYALLVQEARTQRPLPGKQSRDNLGIPLLIPIAIGAAAVLGIGGFTWGISREINESERLKKLSECIENETKRGMSREEAYELCDKIYGENGGGSGGFGNLDLTKIVIYSILGLGGFYLIKGALKDVFE